MKFLNAIEGLIDLIWETKILSEITIRKEYENTSELSSRINENQVDYLSKVVASLIHSGEIDFVTSDEAMQGTVCAPINLDTGDDTNMLLSFLRGEVLFLNLQIDL